MEGKYKGLGTSALLSHRIILNVVLYCQDDVALSSALVVGLSDLEMIVVKRIELLYRRVIFEQTDGILARQI